MTPVPYAWPEGRRGTFCFTVDVDAEAPYLWSLKDGPAPGLLSQMEQRLFGPRTGIWRILDLLDRFGIKGTFFVPGSVAEAHPALLPAFVSRGHEIGLHGYFHELAKQISDEEFSLALEASFEIFHRQVGIKPRGFRSPAWEMTPHMLEEVRQRGLYDSSLMGFDHPYTIGGVTEVPVQWMIDDAVFAGMLARDRVRLRPQGSRRLANELRQKGVDEETARTAIRETMEGEQTDERELARRAAAKWKSRAGEEPERARRRLHGFLARRGFDGDVIREVMDETLPDEAFE